MDGYIIHDEQKQRSPCSVGLLLAAMAECVDFTMTLSAVRNAPNNARVCIPENLFCKTYLYRWQALLVACNCQVLSNQSNYCATVIGTLLVYIYWLETLESATFDDDMAIVMYRYSRADVTTQTKLRPLL